MAIRATELKLVTGPDGSCEVSYIATDNSIELKLSLSNQQVDALVGELNASPSVNFDGTIYVSVDCEVQGASVGKTYFIDHLVDQAVQPQMLEDEPEAVHMLSEFRIRLLKSLELVEQAIASLPKP